MASAQSSPSRPGASQSIVPTQAVLSLAVLGCKYRPLSVVGVFRLTATPDPNSGKKAAMMSIAEK